MLYSLLLCALLPAALLGLLWRSRVDPDYRRRIGERLGWYRQPPPEDGCLWIHAVSVGELQAAFRLLEAIRARDASARVLLTTTTPAASRLLRQRLGEGVRHVYAPWDLGGALRRFLDQYRPRALLLVETELWPNWLAGCAARGIPAALVNARLSARSARRYTLATPLLREMLERLALVAARSPEDAARFRELGMPDARIAVCGDLKFDCAPAPEARTRIAALRAALPAVTSWVAASLHAGEEGAVLEAHRALATMHPGARLLLAPRHPGRAQAVLRLAQDRGFTVMAWDGGALPAVVPAVLVLEGIGELARLCGFGDFVFIGGTFVARGGHNPLEAAHWGVPLLSGDSWFNHRQIAAELAVAGALRVVGDGAALASAVCALAADPAERAQRGVAALAVARAQPRASTALMQRLVPLL
jgi:3-deoxy-D-manno-octulosonic-acid transferase